MPDNNYRYLKDLQNNVIKPVTDLAAVNLTTANGIAVDDNTIGVQNGYVASCAYMELTDPATAANVDSAYIEGGTMFTLLGGYTVTDEIPPISGASHEKVPSEYSVRSAIDALATLGPSMAPGAGIIVETVSGGSGGTIAVAPGNGINVATAQQGGVSVKTPANGGLSVTSDGVSVNAGNGVSISGNSVTVAAKTSGGIAVDSSGVSVLAGETLDLTGGTVNAKVADVGEVLTGLVAGSTVADKVEEVTPDNLKGALSVGQAVDVSCAATNAYGVSSITVSVDGGTTYVSRGSDDYKNNFLSDTFLKFQNTDSSAKNAWFGFDPKFPKGADGLKYVFIVDVALISGTVSSIILNGTGINGLTRTVVNPSSTYTRLACTFVGATAATLSPRDISANSTAIIGVKNWRQYEVTALTDEAIAYLASLPNPDDFFRSTSVFSVRDKYLVKQDMVCPWIYTIDMPDNSDLTVAAGLSYRIKYTNDNAHKITVDTIPTNAYGWDAHVQMFIKGTSAIQFQPPLILMDALTPNAGHNLSIKFRNGDALVYVDDTNAGNIVISATGTTAGTLNYFLQQNPGSGYDNYIIFAPATDGLTCDGGTVSVDYNTDMLGNGTDKTTITGAYTVASGKTMNLQDLAVSGGTFGGTGNIYLDNIILTGQTDLDSGYITISSLILNGDLTDHNTSVGHISLKPGASITSTAGKGTISFNTSVLSNSAVINSDGSLSIENIVIAGGTNRRLLYVTGDTTITGTTFSNLNSERPIDPDNCRITYDNCLFDNCSCYYGVIRGGTAATIEVFNTEVSACQTAVAPITVSFSANIWNIKNLYVHGGNRSEIGFTGHSNFVTIEGTTCSGILITTGYHNICNLTGMNVFDSYINIYPGQDSVLNLISGSTTNAFYIGGNSNSYCCRIGTYVANDFVVNGEATFVINGRTFSISGCEFTGITAAGVINGTPDIRCGSMSLWTAAGAIFGSPLDAHEASTVQLSGTTFTSASKIASEPMRIQLPASTTVSVRGNTNADTTKVIQAPLIVVGDDPAAPSGNATLEYGTNNTSSISGLGTYIAKNGSHDFVANNATNVVAVDNSTTGAKYLGTVLSAATGETGANKFAKIDSGAVAVVDGAVDAVDKHIITHAYEPILGGTFSLTSATVDDATKTVAIQSGGTMSVVDVKGGGNVIDLGGTQINCYNTTVTLNGLTITSGHGTNGGAINATAANGSAVLTSCIISRNSASTAGGGLAALTSGTLILSGCSVIDNYSGNGGGIYNNAKCSMTDCVVTGNNGYGGGGIYTNGTECILSNCIISGNTDRSDNNGDVQINSARTATIAGGTIGNIFTRGTVIFNSTVRVDSVGGSGTMTISSGAILDLTGNTNATPIAPGGGIKMDACTVVTSGGTSCVVSDVVNAPISDISSINNDGTINLNYLNRSASFRNFKFHGVVYSYFTLNNEVTMTVLGGCSMVDMYVGLGATGNGHLVVSGRNKFSVIRRNASSVSCSVTLNDGAILDFDGSTTTQTNLVDCNALTIGDGCSIVLVNGTTVALTGGTYGTLNGKSSAQISKADGTITETA